MNQSLVRVRLFMFAVLAASSPTAKAELATLEVRSSAELLSKRVAVAFALLLLLLLHGVHASRFRCLVQVQSFSRSQPSTLFIDELTIRYHRKCRICLLRIQENIYCRNSPLFAEQVSLAKRDKYLGETVLKAQLRLRPAYFSSTSHHLTLRDHFGRVSVLYCLQTQAT